MGENRNIETKNFVGKIDKLIPLCYNFEEYEIKEKYGMFQMNVNEMIQMGVAVSSFVSFPVAPGF